MGNPKRIVLGTGYLGIANSLGETEAGFSIPCAFGIWLGQTWKPLVGVKIAGKKVRLIAEVLD